MKSVLGSAVLNTVGLLASGGPEGALFTSITGDGAGSVDVAEGVLVSPGGEQYQQLGYDLPVGSDGSGGVLRSSPDINYSYNPSIKTIDNEYGNGFKIKR
ncbi:MAG: hypothetical protein M1576_04235 [Deltaproteobacteria bacterium]|nr:hypothetical protein [Deltaproteobacteria bacterium]